MVEALEGAGFFSGAAKAGEEHPSEDRNYGDHDEEFDQGESVRPACRETIKPRNEHS